MSPSASKSMFATRAEMSIRPFAKKEMSGLRAGLSENCSIWWFHEIKVLSCYNFYKHLEFRFAVVRKVVVEQYSVDGRHEAFKSNTAIFRVVLNISLRGVVGQVFGVNLKAIPPRHWLAEHEHLCLIFKTFYAYMLAQTF